MGSTRREVKMGNSHSIRKTPATKARKRQVTCSYLLAGIGFLLSPVVHCIADWQMTSSSGSVSCSGTNVYMSDTWEGASISSCDATWDANSNGVTASGSGDAYIDVR